MIVPPQPLSEKERFEAWWQSHDVTTARERSGYEQNGDMVAVFEQLLIVVDEREKLPKIESPIFTAAAAEYARAGYGRVERRVPSGAITQMLDFGADPERLRAVFNPKEVDRDLARWAPWRMAVFNLARKGATGEEIRAVCPSGLSWHEILPLLKLHGFHNYPEQPPQTPNQAASERKRVSIMTDYQAGAKHKKIAESHDCSTHYVVWLLRQIRKGLAFQHLTPYLERAA